MEEFFITGIILSFFLGVNVGKWFERRMFYRGLNNYYRIYTAKTLYGENWYRMLTECDESHIANECELCTNIRDK